MTTGGFSSKRLARVRELLERHVDSGFVPGVVAVLARHGEVHVEAAGARERPEAADVPRLLDRRLPGDRRLTAECSPA